MKKIIITQYLILFCIISLPAQIKVFSDGRVAIRGNSINQGNVQVNITEGENTGFCVYKSDWSQIALKVTGGDYTTYLQGYDPVATMFCANQVIVGHKDYVNDYGSKFSAIQSSGQNGNYAISAIATTNDGVGLRAVHQSSTVNGISLYSMVNKTNSLTFASGMNYNTNFYVRGDGTAYTNGVLITSDSTLKENIKNIESPLQKILKIRGVTYNYKRNEKDSPVIIAKSNEEENHATDSENTTSENNNVPKLNPEVMKQIEEEDIVRNHTGFLAQEIESIIPDAVRTTVNGTKAISYTDIIPLLVEGMKEQQAMIMELQQRITSLEISDLNINKIKQSTTSSGLLASNETLSPVLYQNIPNPFSQSTQIRYSLPETVATAYLCIYDMLGKQLKQVAIAERGEGSQIISGSQFTPGIYLYALLADGREVDVKRMILTE